jgi:uncharacterized protein (TIGR03067 family)
MRKALLGVLVIGLLIAADDKSKGDDKSKADDPKDKLKGTWTIVSMERDGQKAPEDQVKGQTLTFEGDKMTIKRDNDTKMATYKIDASQKPAHLDVTPSDGPEKDKTLKMIYQIDGDTLKVGGDKNENGERPKTFETAGMIVTMKREKK